MEGDIRHYRVHGKDKGRGSQKAQDPIVVYRCSIPKTSEVFQRSQDSS
jgi:hypothetical protein